ncbi:PRC-barrel domain-containing protein [Methylobacterium sp. J-048]|uniref:PRC-barrel domain-containing protein n=1 Tax=Methylobacterium sp. J-048 TaxID=2836635 RepID=UPI001FBAED0A|nr:PRC-barrel domain-containing protein [Methylobacterium sp. J-048]MCJ2058567.1 PRC-barrel domain-containing protein [Methylobacterium sp. J-048]
MIAAVTLALWASGVAAQAPSIRGDGASGQVPPPSPPAAQPAPGATTGTAPAVAPPAPAPAPQAPPTNAAQQQQQGTPATVLDTQDYESLLGRSVRSAGGDELGRVIDIIIDKDGHPRAAIIDFGGFLGVGTRKIAVDWRALRFTADGNKERKLSVALSRNQVRVSPEYKAGEPIVVLGPASPAAPTPEGDQAITAAPPAGGPAAPAPTATAPTALAPASGAAAPSAVPATPPEKAPDK